MAYSKTLTQFALVVACAASTACTQPQTSSDQLENKQHIAAAEAFIDAFYSFDPERLQSTLAQAQSSVPSMLYYQGWAEGGNYQIVERLPCALNDISVDCPITVKDDLIGALGVDFNVTDTFRLTFAGDLITEVTSSSNDPDVFYAAQTWVQEHRPALIEKPCEGFFDGGPTPGDCVRGMVAGFREFVQAQASVK